MGYYSVQRIQPVLDISFALHMVGTQVSRWIVYFLVPNPSTLYALWHSFCSGAAHQDWMHKPKTYHYATRILVDKALYGVYSKEIRTCQQLFAWTKAATYYSVLRMEVGTTEQKARFHFEYVRIGLTDTATKKGECGYCHSLFSRWL